MKRQLLLSGAHDAELVELGRHLRGGRLPGFWALSEISGIV
jgi:hypothetical protein